MGWGLSLEEPEVTDASASASRRATREMLREARGKLRPGQGPWSRQTGRQVSTGEDGRFLLEVSTARALPTTPLISAQAFPKHPAADDFPELVRLVETVGDKGKNAGGRMGTPAG